MPMIARFLSLYFSANSTNQGISSLQGAHQVAQTLIKIGRPLKSASRTSLPSMSFKTKSRLGDSAAVAALFRSAAGRSDSSSAAHAGQAPRASATRLARSHRLFHQRGIIGVGP